MSASAKSVELGPATPAGAGQRKPSKEKRVLAAFYSGMRLTRFQAERELSDHVLPSTVAALQRKGVVIYRKDILVPGYQGGPTRCCEYWLDPAARTKAAELLGIAYNVSTRGST